MPSGNLVWTVAYTKPQAESWAEINLRRQGFATILPRVRARSGCAPLFPRYLFVGYDTGARLSSLRGTLGIQYIVAFDDAPARVPPDVIAEIQGRMDARGIVTVDPAARRDTLFARAQRDRIRTLIKLANAGFRVVA